MKKYVNQLMASGLDVFAIDFRRVFEWRKKELGKHYDRDKMTTMKLKTRNKFQR